jgi:hypothetical protein
MASTPVNQLNQKEARLLLTTRSIRLNQVSSVKKAALTYNIPRLTLQQRLQERLPFTQTNSQKRKILPLKSML